MKKGIIHFHDSDYFAQKEHNCDLINLEDMLQNGTVISETMIEKPHSFFTACNVTTQIVAQVASNQYGGQSFTSGSSGTVCGCEQRKDPQSGHRREKECLGEAYGSRYHYHKIAERRLREEVQERDPDDPVSADHSDDL